MVGSLLKKANLSTPRRPSTCAAIFLFVDAASLWRPELVKANLPEVNQFTGNCFRVVRTVLKITFLKLRYPGQRPESPTHGSSHDRDFRKRPGDFLRFPTNFRRLPNVAEN